MTMNFLTERLYLPCSIMRLLLPALFLSASPAYAAKYYLKKSNGDSDPTWIEYENGAEMTGVSAEHDYVVRGAATNFTAKSMYYVNSTTIGESVGESVIGGRLYMYNSSFDNLVYYE